MTLVVPRMIGALSGFIERHGTWPTKLVVPTENWLAYRKDPERALTSSALEDVTRAAFARLELVPIPRQVYIAVDEEGRWFDYGAELEPSLDAWGTVRAALQVPATAGREVHRRSPDTRNGTSAIHLSRPIEDSYVVPGALLAAGKYPGSPPSVPEAEAREKLAAFLDAGITAYVDLTGPSERLAPYVPLLRELAAERGVDIVHDRLTIRDMDVCDAAHMRQVLDTIDDRLAAGRRVYVHCWGGIGRTGMVVGCWLVRHGRTGDQALREVDALFRTMSPERVRKHGGWGSPQTSAQREFVRTWAGHDLPNGSGGLQHGNAAPARTGNGTPPLLLDRYLGAMLGLAVGDALGTTLEFSSPGTFQPITDMVGGGPFGLAPGQWTDDTSMALCLAESLLECAGFDAADQMRRYVRWVDEGHWSSTGRCFDVGNVVRHALSAFRRTGNGFSGPVDEKTAGNGSLMRLAPVASFFAGNPELAIHMAADSSRTTHGTGAAVDACRYFAGLLVGALSGTPKAELLSSGFAPVAALWEREPLHPAVAAVAEGSFRCKAPPEIRGGKGYVIDTLEAALWAFATTDDFTSGALAAVNLGGDADTTGAVYGQIAGAYYGARAIPARWRTRIALGEQIGEIAKSLFEAAGW